MDLELRLIMESRSRLMLIVDEQSFLMGDLDLKLSIDRSGLFFSLCFCGQDGLWPWSLKDDIPRVVSFIIPCYLSKGTSG